MWYMLAADTCANLLRQPVDGIREKLSAMPAEAMAISALTLGELHHTLEKRLSPELTSGAIGLFLEHVKALPWDQEAATAYGRLRCMLEQQGTPLSPLDVLTAAHAISRRCVLVTGNTRQFSLVPTLQVESWKQ